MSNSYFKFKQFTVRQENAAFKVGTDGVLLGASADLGNASSVLDVGTGTGLVALMCAQRSDARITAIEPDVSSFAQAVENFGMSPWSARIKAVNSGLREFAPAAGETYDVIISNPPYFRDSLLNPEAGKAMSRHAFSLSSGELLKYSLRLMNETGNLQIILPYAEGSLFVAEAGLAGLYCNSQLKIKSVPGGNVIRVIMKFERHRVRPHESFLTIETGPRHNYTADYKKLTKDFYLKF